MNSEQNKRLSITVLVVIASFHLVSAQYRFYDDLRGNYCRNRIGNGTHCCRGRTDPCSVEILGTLCYCDEFCNREQNPDCCPDYWRTCLGEPDPPEPQIRKCRVKNMEIIPGTSAMDNCNKCYCNVKGHLSCETDPCLIDQEILSSLQSGAQRNGWTPTNYTQFWGIKLDEGLMKFTGTLPPDEKSLRMHPIKLHYDFEQIPSSFDARDKWKRYLGTVRDQGACASSWAFSTISVAEDRLTIASDGAEVVKLSTQNLLSCNRRGQQACKGGHVERAWSYLRRVGVVTEECYPYTSGQNGASDRCKVSVDANLQTINCERKEFPMSRTELYSTEPAYRIASKEGDIMWELMTNGPVQALMRVYQDFFLYRSGVYSWSNLNGNGKFSVHSVKLLGWGEERSSYGPPTKYWLATNSWGENWGERGFFKIRRGMNESGIEQFILAVRTHLAEEAKAVNRRRTSIHGKRRRPSRKQY